MKIILDADALFASVFENDPSHSKSLEILKKYFDSDWYLAETTFAEIISTIGRKVDKKISLKVIDFVRSHAFVIVYMNEELFKLGEEYYRKQNSKKNTFFDCLNMALAKTYQADYIFTFDRGYEQNGFKLLK